MTTTANRRPPGDAGEPSVGDLVKQATEQLSDLVRGEMRPARAAEVRERVRTAASERPVGPPLAVVAGGVALLLAVLVVRGKRAERGRI